jgi:lipopolysaccharide export system protein LptA
MRLVPWRFLVVLLVGVGGVVFSQEKGFEVRSANVLDVRSIGADQIQALIGNVFMVQPSATGLVKLWCDSAFRNLRTNVVQLYGRVKVVRDSITMTSSEGTYYGDERRAEMSRGVRLVRGGMILTARFGEYWANDKRAHFVGDVLVVDSTSSTRSDALTYFENDEKSIAVGHVRVDNPENSLTVFGDSLVHFDRARYTVIPSNPRLMQIDTVADGKIDTLLVSGAFMESFQDSVQRFITSGLVEMARSDFAARCGEALYFHTKDRLILRDHPVVWHGENQVTGDSVSITTRERKLESVWVSGRSMAVSRADTIRRDRFNQLLAREITLRFRDGKIDQIDAERNATSLYYLFDGDQPNGVNRSSGDRIVMDFLSGHIDRIKILGGVEGKYFPEPMIAKRERQYNLEGFRWLSDRPQRRLLTIVHESYE